MAVAIFLINKCNCMEQENNQPENGNTGKEGLEQAHQSGDDIIKGANQTDQLDEFKNTPREGTKDLNIEDKTGAEPDAYVAPKQRDGKSEDDKPSE
jgi:hypothetical protein